MATMNPFDLLGDDAEDPSLFIAAQQQKQATQAQPAKKGPVQAQAQPAKAAAAAKLPSKSLPSAQAVREQRNEGQRGGGRGGPRGGARGRGRGRGFNQDSADDENTFGSNNGFSGRYRLQEDGESGKLSERRGGYSGPRGGFRGGRRGGFSNGDAADGEHQRRVYERRSGTGRGSEIKREGSGRGNWGTPADDIAPETEEPVTEGEKIVDTEKHVGQEDAADANKDSVAVEPEEKEPEEKEMTLEEYEKLMKEKRRALLALKPEERKVNVDKEFESMQLLSNKKNDDDIFVKLDTDKDKRKEAVDKAKKTKTINEFLKPAEGESYYRPGGRGRGRGRGRGGFGGGFGRNNSVEAPSIEDVGQFPTLGVK